jgi:succinyl-diaminopimelate desuccinylase
MVKSIINKHNKKYELNYKISANSFIQKQTGYISQFADVVGNTLGMKPNFSTGGGTSDARFIKDYCPVVEFGLLSETAHQANEYTEISNLQRLYNVYYHSLCKFLK